jgi:RIO kinase 1
MIDPFAPLLADGVIDEIVARLKSGKEADVWLVRHAGELLAAKVYKARHARSFKHNSAYKEGRQVRNSRTQRAMKRGSRFGQVAAEDAWKAKESEALHRLHAAGVRVPRPVLFHEGVLLMEVVVDAHGRPAPRLVEASISREQAAGIYADLRKQAVGMLACDLIHGDLSPYNVLVGWNGNVVIDMPQVVDAAHNSQAESFFLRDLQNIHRFCASLDPALRAAEGEGREIWRAYVRRELTADFVPTGRSSEPQRHRSRDGRERPSASRPGPAPAQHPGARGAAPGSAGNRSGPDSRSSPQRTSRGDHPGARPQQGSHAQSSPRAPAPGGSPTFRAALGRAASSGQRRIDPRARRNGPTPEVIRVVRPPQGTPAGTKGDSGAGVRRRRRRRRAGA